MLSNSLFSTGENKIRRKNVKQMTQLLSLTQRDSGVKEGYEHVAAVH